MLITATHLIQNTLQLYTRNLGAIVKYLGAMFVVWGLLALNAIAGFSFFPRVLGTAGAIVGVVIQFTILGLFFLVTIAFNRTLQRVVREEPVNTIWTEIKAAKKVFLPAIAVSFLLTLIVMLGMILFIIPGIVFALWYYFASYAAMLDNQKTFAALKFSKSLVAGRFGAVLWRLCAPITLYVVFFSVVTWLIVTPGQYFLASTGQMSGYWISISLGILFYFLLFPVITLTPILLYEHLKSTQGQVE